MMNEDQMIIKELEKAQDEIEVSNKQSCIQFFFYMFPSSSLRKRDVCI